MVVIWAAAAQATADNSGESDRPKLRDMVSPIFTKSVYRRRVKGMKREGETGWCDMKGSSLFAGATREFPLRA
jgi:hypothetical protein